MLLKPDNSKSYRQTDVVFFGVAIFMATGLVIVALLDLVEQRFERWRPDAR